MPDSDFARTRRDGPTVSAPRLMTRPRLNHPEFTACKTALSDLIHLAGKQRTLSHQIMLCASLLAKFETSGRSDALYDQMKTARAEFDRIAAALRDGNEEMRIPAIAVEYLWSSGCVDRRDLDQMREFQRRSGVLFKTDKPGELPDISPDWVIRTSQYVSGTLMRSLNDLTFGVRNSLNQLLALELEQATANRDLIVTATGELKRMSNTVQMLAINAKVESRRIGDAGRPMQFVADEMTKLSKSVREFSHKISEYIVQQTKD